MVGFTGGLFNGFAIDNDLVADLFYMGNGTARVVDRASSGNHGLVLLFPLPDIGLKWSPGSGASCWPNPHRSARLFVLLPD